MKNMRHLFLIFLVAATLTACGEALTTSAVSTGMPIVESYLYEGDVEATVKVYSMEVYLGDDYILSRPVEGLQLHINGRELTETGPGAYFVNLGEDTLRGLQHCDLSFEHLGKTISASTTVPQPIANLRIEPAQITRSSSYYFWDTAADTIEIKLTWDDPDHSYYQLYIESPASSDIPLPGGGMQFRRRMMQPFQGNSHTVTSREFRAVGNYSIYVYRVNKDYADLYERISSTDLANPSSAIQNAFGIFTAISAAKVVFQVTEAEEE
jgi:hypothetical protein